MNRKDFLTISKGIAVGCAVSSAPLKLLASNIALQEQNILVLIHLKGGNDGLNTVIPLDQYDNLMNARSNILLPEKKILKLTDNIGLHPAMAAIKNMFDDGQVNIVQGVGVSDTCTTHSKTTALWMNNFNVNDGYRVSDKLPLHEQLKKVSSLINRGDNTSTYITTLDGFDTHVQQADKQAALLHTCSEAVYSFHKEAKRLGFENRITTIAFTEFGRRIKSNSFAGTDHGTSSPVFVFGKNTSPGITGTNTLIPCNATLNDNLPQLATAVSLLTTLNIG